MAASITTAGTSLPVTSILHFLPVRYRQIIIMPVVQTVALDRDRKFVQLALLTPAEKKKLQEAMDRQLELVAHAIIRGQDLPALGDTSFSISPPHLEVLRLTNIINSMILPSSSTQAREDVQLSRFESTFSSLDLSRLVLQHVGILDMRSLAAVSTTCREIVGSGRRTWNLATRTFGLCDMRFEDQAPGQVKHPGDAIWVHGRDTWITDRLGHFVHRDEQFAMDAEFAAHDTAAANLALAAFRSLWQGKPLSRDADVERKKVTKKFKVEFDRVVATAIAIFKSVPDSLKANIYYAKFDRLKPMLLSFSQYGHHLRKVHLDNLPFMDVRALTVVIENMPNLSDLVVEACELLHLGHLNSILDILYWIGIRRSRFMHFDFFPKAWFGPRKRRTATCVLTFNPPINDEHPRMVMATIIFAVMKAWTMNLDITKPGSLLEKYLLLVPMEFGLMTLFLRHLRVYAAICRIPKNRRTSAQQDSTVASMRQILAAMTRPVYKMKFEGIRTFNATLMSTLMRQCRECRNMVYMYLLRPEDWYCATGSEDNVCLACQLPALIQADDHGWLHEKRCIMDAVFGVKQYREETDSSETEEEAEEFEVPHALDQICPMIENSFVSHPRPKNQPGGKARWLDEMKRNLWYGKYASETLRNVHLNTGAWRQAAAQAQWLDSKNRFAKHGMSVSMDDVNGVAQPYREHYLADRSWEGIYEQNLVAQGHEHVINDVDHMNWRNIRGYFGRRTD